MKPINRLLIFLTIISLSSESLAKITSQLKNKRIKYTIAGIASGALLSKFANQSTLYFGPFSKFKFSDEETTEPILLLLPLIGGVIGFHISKYNTQDYFLHESKKMLRDMNNVIEIIKKSELIKENYIDNINGIYSIKEFIRILNRSLKELSKIEEYLENAIGNKKENHWLVIESRKCMLQVIENDKLLRQAISVLNS